MTTEKRVIAKLIDFEKRGSKYRFRVRVWPDDAFLEVIKRLKGRIGPGLRTWYAEARFWEVAATPQVRDALREIFENGEHCITLVDAQMRMFE